MSEDSSEQRFLKIKKGYNKMHKKSEFLLVF